MISTMKIKHLIAACAAMLIPLAAHSQDLPNKPLSIVVGFAAGGAADHAARVVAKQLTENIGVSVVVENKPGAGGNIAHQYVSRAPADGSVILLGSVARCRLPLTWSRLATTPKRTWHR